MTEKVVGKNVFNTDICYCQQSKVFNFDLISRLCTVCNKPRSNGQIAAPHWQHVFDVSTHTAGAVVSVYETVCYMSFMATSELV